MKIHLYSTAFKKSHTDATHSNKHTHTYALRMVELIFKLLTCLSVAVLGLIVLFKDTFLLGGAENRITNYEKILNKS